MSFYQKNLAQKLAQIECKENGCTRRGGWVLAENGEKFFCYKNFHDGHKNHFVKLSLMDFVEVLGMTKQQAIEILSK